MTARPSLDGLGLPTVSRRLGPLRWVIAQMGLWALQSRLRHHLRRWARRGGDVVRIPYSLDELLVIVAVTALSEIGRPLRLLDRGWPTRLWCRPSPPREAIRPGNSNRLLVLVSLRIWRASDPSSREIKKQVSSHSFHGPFTASLLKSSAPFHRAFAQPHSAVAEVLAALGGIGRPRIIFTKSRRTPW